LEILFVNSPRFEVPLALQSIFNENNILHSSWADAAVKKLGKDFFSRLNGTYDSPSLWSVISDGMGDINLDKNYLFSIAKLREIPEPDFQFNILQGIFHDGNIAKLLINENITLKESISISGSQKLEWLEFIGLYPYDNSKNIIKSINLLIQQPENFKKTITEILSGFWNNVFKDTWDSMQNEINDSLNNYKRLFASLTFKEFAKEAFIRIEVDERKNTISALRGGFTLNMNCIDKCFFIPSMFNDKRFWTVYKTKGNMYNVYIPYFDHQLSPDKTEHYPAKPQTDISLILKALGDTTRFAMIKLISSKKQSSKDLAAKLSLSKSTISHHLNILRESGLIDETPEGSCNIISLNTGLINEISSLLKDKLKIK
jgi:ArsR family transcriptional regulator, repressor of sdpIR and other operons